MFLFGLFSSALASVAPSSDQISLWMQKDSFQHGYISNSKSVFVVEQSLFSAVKVYVLTLRGRWRDVLLGYVFLRRRKGLHGHALLCRSGILLDQLKRITITK